MARIPMTGGFSLMDEGIQVLRIYGVDYNEKFGNLTIYMVNAKAQTMRETFRFKGKNGQPNEGAMNAFSYFAKTAMDDFGMEDVDPMDLIGHYIEVEVIHNETDDGRTFANLGREKNVAYEFDTTPDPKALSMTMSDKKAQKKKPEPREETPAPETEYDLNALLEGG